MTGYEIACGIVTRLAEDGDLSTRDLRALVADLTAEIDERTRGMRRYWVRAWWQARRRRMTR